MPATTIVSVVFGAIVWLTGGPFWVCVIVIGLTFILIWTDEKIGVVIGGIEQLLALL